MTAMKLQRPLPPARKPGFLASIVVAGALLAAAIPAAVMSYRSLDDGEDAKTAVAGLPFTFGRGSAAPDIDKLQARVKANPDDFAAKISLANAYLQAVRETGDPTLYTRAGALLDDAGKLEPGNPELLATRAILALGLHDFALALDLGKQALAADPERARYFGIVADAQVELGMYDEAVVNLQEMVNRRPDFNAYSRIAYLRELYGDPEGALEAMDLAIEAGSSVPENVAWAEVQAGNLLIQLGRYDDAAARYAEAEVRLPGYALAIAGRARVAAARQELGAAQDLYQQAFERMPIAGHAVALGEVAEARGDGAAAKRHFETADAINALAIANGQATDVEHALFRADHGSATEAVRLAREAYASRPNVVAADALAWALYKDGKAAEALPYSREARRLGSRDTTFLFHAALIERAAGDRADAVALLRQVVNVSPRFSLRYADEAAKALTDWQ